MAATEPQTKTQIRATIDYLKACQHAREHGYPVVYKTDPAWLVNVAINRRAGWPDDSHHYGSCSPLPDGGYPPKARGDVESAIRRLSSLLRDHPRVIIRETELGAWKGYLTRRWPDRFKDPDADDVPPLGFNPWSEDISRLNHALTFRRAVRRRLARAARGRNVKILKNSA